MLKNNTWKSNKDS